MSGPPFLSPLRYPGGKGRLGPYLARVLASQSSIIDTYCEPYAGGAGAGLHLLSEGYVNRLIINDLNPESLRSGGQCAITRSRWSLSSRTAQWTSVAGTTNTYGAPHEYDDLTLGFATFFLNRTNRSGILSARPIGEWTRPADGLSTARFDQGRPHPED